MIALLLALLGPAAACEAVADVTVHTPTGPQAGWDVAWDNGVILRVGPGAAAGCSTRRLPSGQLTPGLVAFGTALGLVEVSMEGGSHDDGGGAEPVRAALQVIEGYNPRSVVIPVTRAGGITASVIQPSGGFIAGQLGAVRLAGDTWDEAVLSRASGVRLSLREPGGVAAGILRLEELLDDAAALTRAGARGLEISEALSASRRDLEVMAQVAQGALPLVVEADQASDIEAVLRLRERRKLRVIVVGGAEAWLVAPQLAAAKVPVVIRPFVYGAGSFDQVHGREDNGALLRAAGVEVIIGAGDTHNARAMRFAAGNAVRGGMSHADALRAITEAPATAFGLGGRGRIAVGAPADLALWTGDPLDTAGRLAAVWIDGAERSLSTRQTALVDRWRDVKPVWAE